MSKIYINTSRADEPHALPNAEVFYLHVNNDPYGEPLPVGWYWWPCFPGCHPDGEPNGPFDTEAEATYDAQE